MKVGEVRENKIILKLSQSLGNNDWSLFNVEAEQCSGTLSPKPNQ